MRSSLQGEVARRELRQAVKYGIVGFSNVAIDFALYAALVAFGVWYPLAKTLSLVIATANGYTFNRLWTFRAGPHRNVVLTKYVTVQASCPFHYAAATASVVERPSTSARHSGISALPSLRLPKNWMIISPLAS